MSINSASNKSGSTNSNESADTQGGTHEQHVKAGRQSHKKDGNSFGSSKFSGDPDRSSSKTASGSELKSGSGSSSSKR